MRRKDAEGLRAAWMKPLRLCAAECAAPPSGFAGNTPRTLPPPEELRAGSYPGRHARNKDQGAPCAFPPPRRKPAPCAQTVFPRFSRTGGNALFSAEALPFNDSAL